MTGNPTVVFPEPGKIVLENRVKPEPKAGELLVQTRGTLISTGTELTMLSGKYPTDSFWDKYVKYPVTPGYCNIGLVIEIGADVDKKWLGQVVGSYGNHALYVTVLADQARLVHRDILKITRPFLRLVKL